MAGVTPRDPLCLDIEGLIQGTINVLPPSQTKIFKVNDRLRQVKADDYEPKIIAIGPIHGGKDHLKMMEHKLRYLNQLLQRCQETGLSIDRLVQKLKEMQEDARLCYPTDLNFNGENFVKMLLLDGCFIIELVRKYFANNSTEENDPVFKSETLSQIRYDLMLVENQLPLSVTNQLFEMTKTNDPDENLWLLVKNLVDDMFPWPDILKSRLTVTPEQLGGIDHLLGLTYQSFSQFSTKSRLSTREKICKMLWWIFKILQVLAVGICKMLWWICKMILRVLVCKIHINSDLDLAGRSKGGIHINSASELKEAGISLKPSKDNSLTFDNGVLKLPPFQVSGKTESVLRNLMAYEQLRLDDGHQPKHVTDYVFFMHCLIRSKKDVEVLRRKGVLDNYLGGDVTVYHMLDGLVTNFHRSSEFCYSGIFERLNGHCGRRREKWMARLWRDYFNSPWSLLAFIAATLLLGISITQLVFAVLTYKHRKKRV